MIPDGERLETAVTAMLEELRAEQGRYRINPQHPDLVALRRKALEERGREG